MTRLSTEQPGSARERILATASDLFYRKGINNVGINEVIEASAIARMTLYHHFKSKDDLVLAVLLEKLKKRQMRIETGIKQAGDARGKVAAIFDVLHEIVRVENYRGCAFINAAIEYASTDGPVHAVAAGYKHWLYERFEEIARAASWHKPSMLAQQLLLLWDGVAVGAYLHHSPAPAKAAFEVAELLIEKASRH